MRRILSVALVVLLIATLCTVGVFATGSDAATSEPATPANPLPINTAEDFAAMTADGNYILAADITLTAPYAGVFKGTLDGNGKTVTVSAPMFTELEGATIKNLTTVGEIVITAETEGKPAAGLAGVAYQSTIYGVTNKATIQPGTETIPAEVEGGEPTTVTYKASFVAGVVASMYGSNTVENCVNDAELVGGTATIGGVVGYMSCDVPAEQTAPEGATAEEIAAIELANSRIPYYQNAVVLVKGCVNNGKISGGTNANGGVFGYANGGDGNPAYVTIENCVNNAEVIGHNQTGGITGWVRTNGTIKGCVNNAPVSSLTNYAGGIAGRAHYNTDWTLHAETPTDFFVFENCENNGTVKAKKSQVGGIIGYANNPIKAVGCTNNGLLEWLDGTKVVVGGIAGSVGSKIHFEDCTNTANLSYYKTNIGGIIGVSNYDKDTTATFINCVNTGNVEGGDQSGGIVGWARQHTITITNCQNLANVTSRTNYAGGIAGRLGSDSTNVNYVMVLENCLNTGNVVGDRQYAAGMVGYCANNVILRSCVNSGNISIRYTEVPASDWKCPDCAKAFTDHWGDVGGLVGRVQFFGDFFDCINIGNVVGSQNAGGMIGKCGNGNANGNQPAAYFDNIYHDFVRCMNLGNVTNKNLITPALTECAGGLVGYMYSNRIMAANVYGCVVAGTITMDAPATGALSGVAAMYVGYGNSYCHKLEYNIFAGTLVAPESITVSQAAIGTEIMKDEQGNIVYGVYEEKKDGAVINTVYGMIASGEKDADGKDILIPGTFENAYAQFVVATEKQDVTLPGSLMMPWVNTNMLIGTHSYKNNYVVAGTTTTYDYVYGTVTAFPADYAWTFTAEELANGALAAKLNTEAGETLFYQDAALDAVPVTHAHNAVESDGGKAPTCTEPGMSSLTYCSICQITIAQGAEVPAKGHSEGEPATCTTASKCADCGVTLKDALGHAPGNPADCTKTQNCLQCGIVLAEKTAHYEKTNKAVAPTCTKTGKTEGKSCMLCGEVIVAQEVVPALGHGTTTDVAAVAPTCTKAGTAAAKKCTVCNTVVEGGEAVPATGHTEEVVAAVAATCTEAGLTEGKKCSVCGEVLVAQEEVAALGHTEEVLAAVAPTTSATGLTEGKKCSVCDEVLVAQEEVAKLPEETTKAPETEAPAGGCGGTIGATVALVAVALLAPAGIMLKKKED